MLVRRITTVFAFALGVATFGPLEFSTKGLSTTPLAQAQVRFKSQLKGFSGRDLARRGFSRSGIAQSGRRSFNGDLQLFQRQQERILRNERVFLENQARRAGNSGVILSGPGSRTSFNNGVGVNSNLLFARGFLQDGFTQGPTARGIGLARSGVNSGGVRSFNGDLILFQRQQERILRNERVFLENQARRANSAGTTLNSGGIARQGQVTADVGGATGPAFAQANPCPENHNCGYRLYQNGTGARIITPGISAGNGLPPFDGVNGPVIISPRN